MLPYSNRANSLAALHNIHAHVCFIVKMLGMIAQPCVCRHESLQKPALLVWMTRPRLMKGSGVITSVPWLSSGKSELVWLQPQLLGY